MVVVYCWGLSDKFIIILTFSIGPETPPVKIGREF